MTLVLKMSSACGYLPVFHSSAPIFDAPGVGSAMVTTPEAMMNRLLFILKCCGGKRRRSCPRHPQPPFLWNVLCLPPPVSERNEAFELPRKKISRNFFSAHYLWKEATCFERKKTENSKKKAPKITRMRQTCHQAPDFWGLFSFCAF